MSKIKEKIAFAFAFAQSEWAIKFILEDIILPSVRTHLNRQVGHNHLDWTRTGDYFHLVYILVAQIALLDCEYDILVDTLKPHKRPAQFGVKQNFGCRNFNLQS